MKCSRRTWLTSLAAGAVVARWGIKNASGNEGPRVPWLAEVQTPPAKLPPDAPELSDLLQTKEGEKIDSLDAWKKRRAELRNNWLEFLGPLPAERTAPPKLKVLAEDRVENVVRQLVEYEVEPGLLTQAYLVQPRAAQGKLPGAVVFHSTVNHSIRQPAGVEGAPEKAFGLKLAQAGWVCFCPRNYLWPTNDRIAAQAEAERFSKRMPNSKGMAKMLYDGLVAVDILAAQPNVDVARLAAVGHSLGAKEALYQAAFDERIAVAVSSEGGIGTRFSNWEAPWYLGPAIRDGRWTREHHELLALAAPRAFLLVGGESADGDRGWPFIQKALPVYRLYDSINPPPLGFFNHRQGHAVPPIAEKRIAEWLGA
jgi:dienelactone hydrolase